MSEFQKVEAQLKEWREEFFHLQVKIEKAEKFLRDTAEVEKATNAIKKNVKPEAWKKRNKSNQ
jgi:hypothetical protein